MTPTASIRLLTGFALFAPVFAVAEQRVDFSRDVQPILSEYCYACHGPDEKARKASLRLDTKEGTFRTKDDVTVVKPKDPAHSELIARITTDDTDDVMPPPRSKKKLKPQQIALLKNWIEQGAPWGEHWAFIAPKKPAVPDIQSLMSNVQSPKSDALSPSTAGAVSEGGRPRTWDLEPWTKNPIDAFVLKKLADEKLSPSPEASKEKLLRRVTLDLTGLPPTPKEVDAFLADKSPDAYEKVVDRLLASKRYGERMVWDWLDAGRYADTNGYQGDPTRTMWYWRDWAIKALNDNMPFDKFTIEQFAGDLLPEPTRDQIIATGFHRNHMMNGEGGRIAEETRVENVQDRVETTGEVWLGLTFTCCRCHDHKFDPLLQRDYYQLSAYFNSIDEGVDSGREGNARPVLSLATPEQKKHFEDLKATAERLKKEREELMKQVRNEQPQWETALAAGQAKAAEIEWQVIKPLETISEQHAVLTAQPDNSVLASGPNPDNDDYVITAETQIKEASGLKLEVLPDESLPNKAAGRAPDGSFLLSDIEMIGDGKQVDLAAVGADLEQPEWPLKDAVDKKADTGWGAWQPDGKPHVAMFEIKTKFGYRTIRRLSFRLHFQSNQKQHAIARFRISITNSPAALLRPMPDDVKAALAVEADKRTDEQKKTVTDYYLAVEPRLIESKEKLEAAQTARNMAEKSLPATMVLSEREKPRDTFILVRGAYDKPAEKVSPDVPGFLPHLPSDAPRNRIALARWLVSPENPLTARVTVNRYWQTFFGTGIVKTVDDFGVQGDKPSHPELLDWLAREFIESGWNVKHMHRLIVTSETYKQSSVVPPGMAERDPENRLLARGPRYRLPSWMLRDQALAVSGLLTEKLGGPPVNSYQPEGIWEEATFGVIKYNQNHGEALYRRSLYIFWRRIVAPTMFFDVASRQTCAVKVGRTNTPLHALVTLNDVTFVEAARVLAERMLRQSGDEDARIAYAFRLCTSRSPSEKEKPVLAAALARFRKEYSADPEAAKKLIAIGESKPDPKTDPIELAAHTGLTNLLLNLDETLSKE